MPTLPTWEPLAIIVAVAVATMVGLRLAGDDKDVREAVFPTLVDTLAIGLLTARLGYVVQWWPSYAEDLWSIIRIADGGFMLWVGAPCAMAFLLWRLHRRGAQRRALGGAVTAGLITWGLGVLLIARFDAPPAAMPVLTLATLDGHSVEWGAPNGRPRVLNLWATWCPPCRRELPAFFAAQRAHPDIDFVLLNQGEPATVVADYLTAQQLPSDGVLLDDAASASTVLAARAYPVTYFFDAEGRLVDRHFGELTSGGLAGRLQALRDVP